MALHPDQPRFTASPIYRNAVRREAGVSVPPEEYSFSIGGTQHLCEHPPAGAVRGPADRPFVARRRPGDSSLSYPRRRKPQEAEGEEDWDECETDTGE